ncbi:MAG: hypothetical protein LAN71_13595 [Acidobacteriia bacterium]|nr:hypothetical protein [Terriglobia bacterium]
MAELSPLQLRIIERLFAAGCRPLTLAPYENGVCLRRGECAAVLAPVANGGFRLLAPPSYLVEGRLSVLLRRGNREFFVWKSSEVEATAERRAELEQFRRELSALLEEGGPQ